MASPRRTQPWHTKWPAMDAGLEQRNLRDGDLAAEADVHVSARFVAALVIVAVGMERPSRRPKAQGQGSGVERAEDDVRVGRFGRQMRQVDVPENSRRHWLPDEI